MRVGTEIGMGGGTQRRLDFTLTFYLIRVCDKFPFKYNHITDCVGLYSVLLKKRIMKNLINENRRKIPFL